MLSTFKNFSNPEFREKIINEIIWALFTSPLTLRVIGLEVKMKLWNHDFFITSISS